MTKLRLLFSLLILSVVFSSCGGTDNPEPLDVQAAILGSYTGFRIHEEIIVGETKVFADTFDIVITKGRDATTVVFTETPSTFKEKSYRYDVNLESENNNGAKLSIDPQTFQGDDLQGEEYPGTSGGIHGLYLISEDKTSEKLDFILRVKSNGKAIAYDYFFDKK